MTPDEFNNLAKEKQKFLLCDADKIGEFSNELCKEELFKIDNVLVEVKTTHVDRVRREIRAYA